MTEAEFNILDELYFLQSFGDLERNTGYNKELIISTLKSLHEKRWIKCYRTPTDELANENADILFEYNKYHYLATKDGLIAHQGS